MARDKKGSISHSGLSTGKTPLSDLWLTVVTTRGHPSQADDKQGFGKAHHRLGYLSKVHNKKKLAMLLSLQ